MMEAVKAGVGRETAHHAIKQHAVATVNDLREGTISQNDLLTRLANDESLNLDEATLQEILENGRNNVGAAGQQVQQFTAKVDVYLEKFPEAAKYSPGGIL
jgi:adenylosuccinate lyase